MPPPILQDLGDGVHAIDTGFHRDAFDAAYLIVEQGRAAFIDTGTNFAVPRLLQALAHLGLAADAVDWVIPTHVHLDHAGGVGLLMQGLPRARVVAHPRGAKHLIDPRMLYQSALRVYGPEAMAREYGELVPVDRARVDLSHDAQVLHLAGRPLELIDTPGHARHHHAVWDERSRSWFTGDTFGLSYREFDTARGAWILPTSTPVQFEPEPLKRTIARLLDKNPRWMCLTHYARVGDPQRLGGLLLEQIDDMVALAQRLAHEPDRHAKLKQGLAALAREQLVRHGVVDADAGLALLELDIELNAQGLAVWLDRPPRDA